MAALYAEAVEQLREIDATAQVPAENPLTLDHLLQEETNTLLARLITPAEMLPNIKT